MPLKTRVVEKTALIDTGRPTIIKPIPGTLKTKARVIKRIGINRITGEINDLLVKYQKREGVVRLALEQRSTFGRTPTGILSVDLCLAGGFLRSHGAMLIGNKSTGKTTLSLLCIANAQRIQPDMIAVFVDIEGTLDLGWARRLGVDLERLLVIEPESGEEACDLVDGVFRSGEVCIVVVDSIAMLVPMKEVEASQEDNFMGLQPRLVTSFLRKIHQATLQERHRGHYPNLLLLNQWRMKIGVAFGDPRVAPGGNALQFSASQVVETYNQEHRDKDDEVTHNEHDIKITKDKTGGRLKAAKFKLIRNESTGFPVGYIQQARAIVNWGTISGNVEGKYRIHPYGSFRTYEEIDHFFAENPAASWDICSQIVEFFRNRWGIDQHA